MNSTAVALLAALLGLVAILAWVGWRFFLPRQVLAVDSPSVGLSSSVSVVPSEKSAARPVWHQWLASRFLALGLLITASAVTGVLAVSAWVLPDPLTAEQMERQQHIQLALNPERLVPPPALPPSLFVGHDRPALETADRDWAKLDRRFMQSVLQVFVQLRERGYDFALLEGYRSPERQEKLAAMGGHVTNARAYQSRHQYGLAVDIAPMRDGRLIISERDPWAMKAYEALGEEAERAGLIWGGRWSFKDFGHIEAKMDRGAAKAD